MTDNGGYHIIDCGNRGCSLCPAVFRDDETDQAMGTAEAHGADLNPDEEAVVFDIGVDADGDGALRSYPEDDELSLAYTNNWGDERLLRELKFLSVLFHHVCFEVAVRAKEPERQTHDGVIEDRHVELQELSETIKSYAEDDLMS